jgi:peptidoglycan glycosyltransferase
VNTQIRRLGIGLLACYLALFVMLNWIQVVHKHSLDNNALNDLRVKQQFNKDRGTITSSDGVVLAQSVDVTGSADFTRKRVYPQGDLFGQITGFYSFLYGATGLETQYNDELTGQTVNQQVKGFIDLLNPRPQVGNLTITVSKRLQQVARQALGAHAGSVVAVDPRTGALLAFWSFPSFDPNPISSLDAKTARTSWTLYNLGAGKPLLAHQYQEVYPAGSTFKIVTGSTGVEDRVVTVDHPFYPYASGYKPPQTTHTISNFGGEVCGGTLITILEVSCNSAFAQMGTETIGPDRMAAGAQAFGLNRVPPIDLPGAAASRFPLAYLHHDPVDLPSLANQSIGQGNTRVTPLQMALVASAIADGGTIMAPHVMKEIRDSEGNIVERWHDHAWLRPVSSSTAQTMHDAMMSVVAHGTATVLQMPGFDIGGKTGTAQIGNGDIDAWMVAFGGPAGKAPTIALAVVVLDQPGVSESTGAHVAGPVAKQVLEAYLNGPSGGH